MAGRPGDISIGICAWLSVLQAIIRPPAACLGSRVVCRTIFAMKRCLIFPAGRNTRIRFKKLYRHVRFFKSLLFHILPPLTDVVPQVKDLIKLWIQYYYITTYCHKHVTGSNIPTNNTPISNYLLFSPSALSAGLTPPGSAYTFE